MTSKKDKQESEHTCGCGHNGQGHNCQHGGHAGEEHDCQCGGHTGEEHHCQCGSDNEEEACSTEEKAECNIQQEKTIEEELLQAKDLYLRVFAEFENYKKRQNRDRIDFLKMANQDTITAMLPILDDFERGLEEAKKAEDTPVLKGFELIYNKFKEALRQKGLSEIQVKAGDEFDVDTQEAIAQVPAPSQDMKCKVIDITQKGYRLGDKVIRFARVVVGQ